MIRIFKGFLQLLSLRPQTESLQHTGSTVPVLLAVVLGYHLFLDVFQLLVGEVLHEHRLKHLQHISVKTQLDAEKDEQVTFLIIAYPA